MNRKSFIKSLGLLGILPFIPKFLTATQESKQHFVKGFCFLPTLEYDEYGQCLTKYLKVITGVNPRHFDITVFNESIGKFKTLYNEFPNIMYLGEKEQKEIKKITYHSQVQNLVRKEIFKANHNTFYDLQIVKLNIPSYFELRKV